MTLRCSHGSRFCIQPIWQLGRQSWGEKGQWKRQRWRVMEVMSETAERWRQWVKGGWGGVKSNRGFECSPEEPLRSYLGKSIMPHRMWLLLCYKIKSWIQVIVLTLEELHPTAPRPTLPIHLRRNMLKVQGWARGMKQTMMVMMLMMQ